MKHIINYSAIIIGIFILAYLLGSFYATTCNIKFWNNDTRGGVIAGFVFFSMVSSGFYTMINFTPKQ